MSLLCYNCFDKITEDNTFCPKCGSQIQDVERQEDTNVTSGEILYVEGKKNYEVLEGDTRTPLQKSAGFYLGMNGFTGLGLIELFTAAFLYIGFMRFHYWIFGASPISFSIYGIISISLAYYHRHNGRRFRKFTLIWIVLQMISFSIMYIFSFITPYFIYTFLSISNSPLWFNLYNFIVFFYFLLVSITISLSIFGLLADKFGNLQVVRN